MTWLGSASATVVAAGLLLHGCSGSTSPVADERNRPPLFNSEPPAQAGLDSLYVYQIAVTDPDGDRVHVTAQRLPHWLVLDSGGMTLSGTPRFNSLGDHEVELTASDGILRSTQSYTLTVSLDTSSLIFNGSWYGVYGMFHFGHDGYPYESEHFVVYSGFCPAEERQRVADVLEEQLIELKSELHITGDHEFAHLTQNRKIDVFLSKYQVEPNWWGSAYRKGLIYRSRDSPYYRGNGVAYDYILKHELMHVVEFLLTERGRDWMASLTNTWFKEGIAEYVSDLSGSRPRIDDTDGLMQWMDGDGHGNPIATRAWTDIPRARAETGNVGSYFPGFELAFRYLVDPDGHGRTMLDVKNVLLDIRQGRTFEMAFAARIGMSVDEYQASFTDLMTEYLP